jgi:hypothetical protein
LTEILNKMNPLLSLILFLFVTLSAFGQTDTGFTNKAEAKNLMVNGMKEGKWIEYIDADNLVTTNKQKAQCYRLIVYKNDVAYGKVREYTKDGKLNWAAYAHYETKNSIPMDNTPRPNLLITAIIDSVKKANNEFSGHSRIDIIRSQLWLTVTVANNSNDTVFYQYWMCPGLEGLYHTNVDYIDIPTYFVCGKNILYEDTLLPHTLFDLKLMAVAAKTHAELKGTKFKVSFVCRSRSKTYGLGDEGYESRINNLYWSDNLEIK